MIEFALVTCAILFALWALSKLNLEQLKNKQINPLKNAIKSSEQRSKEAAAAALADADGERVIGFLNGLHSNDTDTD